MALESLLLSRDNEVIRVLQPALEKLYIGVEVCCGVRSGHEILRTEKFDAIIVDCDDLDGGLQVLEGLRKTSSNRNSVTFAILNGTTTTKQAFQMGANFVLQKPISTLNATRCFSTALNFIREGKSSKLSRFLLPPSPILRIAGPGYSHCLWMTLRVLFLKATSS
jgi:ActR/RegA family two-component response regulator